MTQIQIAQEKVEIVASGAEPPEVVIQVPAVPEIVVEGVGPAGPPGPEGEIGPVGPGVAPGGLEFQLLQKVSGDDYDTGWTSEISVNSVTFSTVAEVEEVTGRVFWNPDEGTLDVVKLNGVVNQLGQETMMLCRNSTVSTIADGQCVMFAGSLGNSGRLLVAPMVADGTYPGYVFLGVTTQAIAAGEDGYVTVFGKVRGVDTTAWAEGSVLWCDPLAPGGFTNVEPHAPNLKLPIAAVISSKTNGTLMVRADTGRRLMDLHDVEANGNKDDGDVLAWSETNNRWEPVAPSVFSADSLETLNDVDVSMKQDSSVLYYDAVAQLWKGDDVNTMVSLTDGGNF